MSKKELGNVVLPESLVDELIEANTRLAQVQQEVATSTQTVLSEVKKAFDNK